MRGWQIGTHPTVTVTNNDNSGCTSSTFNVTASVPAGWSVTDGGSPATIAPGTTGSATLSVTSPAGTTGGFYPIGATATDAADATRTASTSATYVIASALTVGVASDQTTYARNQTALVTTTVQSNGSPVSGAGVTVTITTPPTGRARPASWFTSPKEHPGHMSGLDVLVSRASELIPIAQGEVGRTYSDSADLDPRHHCLNLWTLCVVLLGPTLDRCHRTRCGLRQRGFRQVDNLIVNDTFEKDRRMPLTVREYVTARGAPKHGKTE